MLDGKIFIGEFGRPVDGARPRAVSLDKVASLDHEILDLGRSAAVLVFDMDSRRWVTSGPCMPTYHAMELAVLVALRPPLCVLALARAELPEILCCAWRDVGEELHLDAA